MDRAEGLELLEAWFAVQGWTPWPFQRAAWSAFLAGDDGLIHVPTGAGKTYAAFGGPLALLADEGKRAAPGLRIVYVTPLRALARDIEQALQVAVQALGCRAAVETRTGDTSSKDRARQRRQLPEVLVTTPESLALLVARDDAADVLGAVTAVIVDEWHELVASKRGAHLELTLARLRGFCPAMRTWGITATISDPEEAARALLPVGRAATVIRGAMARPVVLETLLPETVDPFPWAGHLGLSMVPRLIAVLDPRVSNLIFTNTRSQAERWYQALKEARPDWDAVLALHHGSLAKAAREEVEEGLKLGRLRIVIATSSLDLGVDFPEVEAVYQVGSPKGVARLLQRAGRSAHRPLATCKATCIPTHGLELLEFAAARNALRRGAIERRIPAGAALDVLAQHMVTCALSGGFTADALFDEVRTADAYRALPRAEFDWCLQYCVHGGTVLDAYPAYEKLALENGVYLVKDRKQAMLHRLNIGTIVADEQAELKLQRGKRLGFVDEGYLAKLKRGDKFVFAGRVLELVKLQDLTATVRLAAGKTTNVPAWQGGFLPLSTPLGDELRQLVSRLAQAEPVDEPEVRAAAPILAAQTARSLLPAAEDLLCETWASREGSHLFLYPFAGRAVHEALAALLALRLSRRHRATFAVAANDYGLALVSTAAFDYRGALLPGDFSLAGLEPDLVETIDAAQAAKRRFREVARIAGIVRQNYPGQLRKGGKALHASSALLFDTLARFDPGHPLVAQARREAQTELGASGRLEETMTRLAGARWLWAALKRPSPFCFPLVVERVRARVGSESLAERIEAMKASWLDVKGASDERGPRRRARATGRPRAAARRAGGVLAGTPDLDRGGPPLG